MLAAYKRILVDSWTRRGPLAYGLWPVALVYRLLLALRLRLYAWKILKTHRLGVPVIVVGNVVAGGSGKTPVVIELVRHLRAAGLTPGVVSRGYGRLGTQCQEVLDHSPVATVGDEPLLIRRRSGAPVFVATRRIDAARALLARFPQTNVVLCDDGLQHLALQRDLEVCVFDDRAVGNGLLLPAGPLREPWPRKCDLALAPGPIRGFAPFTVRRSFADHCSQADGKVVALRDLAAMDPQPGQPVWALAGIARPEQFFDMLRAHGIPLAGTIRLNDHAPVRAHDLSPAANCQLLCTEKDAAKVWPFRPDAIAVALRLEIEPAFWACLDRLLVERCGAKLSLPNGHAIA